MPPVPRRALALAALSAALLAVPVAAAHSSGSAVETRVAMPAWVIWFTGAAVVAVSFAVVGAFLSKPSFGAGARRDEEPDAAPRLPRAASAALRGAGVLALLLIVANGFLPASESRFPEAVLWLVVWALLPLAAYSVGNPWEAVSPFRALAPLARRLRGGRAPRAYPARLASWPAVVVLLALIGLEVWEGGGQSATFLGRAALSYTLVTLAGMTAFGEDAWLRNAEVFGRAFRWWSAYAPLRRTRDGVAWRAPGEGLRGLRVAGASDVAFTVALLYGVNFDGFLATGVGEALSGALAPAVGAAGAHVGILFAGFAVFLAAFWACARAIRNASESLEPVSDVAARFAASLVPIAVAYHLAHNLFYVVESAPRLAAALADPLGLGWVAVPAAVAIPAGVAGAIAAAQVLLIVAGHVSAVVVAHHLAFDGFPSRVQAIRSELPLTVGMVFYTLVGLWILSRGHTTAVAGV